MQVNASITKQDIGKCAERYGNTNAKPYSDASPGALVYVTFAGALNPNTGRYDGAHLFRAAVPADRAAPAFDFSKLPGVKS